MTQLIYSEKKRARVVTLFILVNTLIYLAWLFSSLDPSDSEFMMHHFLVSWSSITDGQYWTLLTSEFSHNMFLHFFMNMYVLSSFGPIVERLLGSFRFFGFYLSAGIVSSLCHALVSAFVLGEPDLPALGASGAIAGVILLFSMLFPRQKILIFGLIPIPAVWGAVLFIGLDLWGLLAQAGGGGLPIGHGAHLGGAFTGIIYYYFFLKPKLRKT
jgi:membrane associated rhomboid family serine protease